MNNKFYITLLLVSISLLANAQWTATSGPYGGNITDLERDGSNNTYAIVSQSLYKSTDNGATWAKLVTTSPTSLPVNDLTIVNNKFYAVYYSSFYTSTDGLTWTRTATTFPFSSGAKVFKFGPDGFIAVYGYDGLYVSKDEGATWVKASSDIPYYYTYDRAVATTNGDLYIAARSASVNNYQGVTIKKLPYPGLNGTFDPNNWQTVYSTLKTGTITSSTASTAVIGVGTSFTTQLKVGSALYSGGASPQYIGQVASITNNTSLTLVSNASLTVSASTFYGDPYQGMTQLLANGANVLMIASNDLMITQDAGATWPSIKGNITASSFYGVGGVNSNGAVYISNTNNNGEIYSLINPTTANKTWTITPGTAFTNYGTNVICWAFISTSNILAGTSSAGVFKSTDTGATYNVSTSGITGGNYTDIVVANTSNRIITTFGASGYWTSIDGGTTWSFVSTNTYLTHGLKLSNGNILLYGSKVLRSTDNGATFTTDGVYYGHSKIIEASNGDLYGFLGTNISKSTDQGATWSNLTITGLPTSFYFTQSAIDANATPNFIFQVYDNNASQYKLYKMVGTTATLLTSPYTSYLNNAFFQSGKFYVSQYSAYYYSSDLGATWSTIGFSGNYVFPISNASYSGIAVSKNGSLYTSQDGGGSWNNTTLPTAYQNAYITDIDVDGSGNYFASAQGSPVMKYTSALLVNPSTLPPFINFNWQPLSGPYGGVINKIQTTPDGNTLFTVAGNAGSGNSDLWKYSSGSWSKVARPAGVNGSFDVEVDGSGNVYWLPFISPQKIYKSTDLGVTWNPLTSTGLPASANAIRRIKVLTDGSILAFGVSGGLGSIFKSSDGGATFTSRFTSAYATVLGTIGVSPNSPSNNTRIPGSTAAGVVIMMGDLHDGLLVSTDFGTTWTAKSTASIAGTTTGFVGSYMFDKNGNIVLHAIVDTSQSPWTNQIVKSTDNGTTWSVLPTPNIPIPNSTQIYSKRIITLGTGEYLMCVQSLFDCYRSSDGGATWTNIGNVGDIFLWSTTNGTSSYIMGSSNAGILKTTDGGQTFTTFSNGIPHPNSNDILFMNNNKDLIIGAARPFHSSDYGQTLTLASLEPGANYLQVGDSVIAYGNNRRLLKSTNYGKTWTEFGADNLYYSFLTKDATGSGFYGSDGVNLFYSTDLKSWTNIVLSGLPASYLLDNMVIDQNGVIFAVVIDNNTGLADVYKIVFGSATKISTAIGTQNPYNILFFNNKIYLYDGNGAIYKSTDGETWTQGPAPAGTQLLVSNGYLFVPSGNAVLWLSRNDGATWQSVGDTPATVSPFPLFNNVVINPFDGYAYATISNSVAKKSGNMVIPNDNTKPVVVTYSPTLNATGVGLKPTLSLTFDEVTNAVSGKLIRVFDLANLAVPIETMDMATATQNGKTWSIPTTTNLSFNKTYFVIVDAGAVADIFGNAFLGISSNTTWRFTTKAAPIVSTLSPANSATNVVANSSFKISFTEPVTGLAGKNVTLFAASAPSTPVATLVANTGVSSGNDVTYTFAAGTLQYNTQYFIKADASAFSTADAGVFSALTLNTDWTFTTRSAPTIATLAPSNSATNVDISASNTKLAITLSENFTFVSGKKIYVTNTAVPATPVFSIDLSGAVFAGAKATITLPGDLNYSLTYAITFDANAFTATSDGASFSLLTTTGWQFNTMGPPDTTPPSIAHTPANLSQGSGNGTISVTVTDNGSGVDTVKIYYRSITTKGAFTSAKLTGSNNVYSATIPETAYGPMGLEYYFTAKDVAGNQSRGPATGSYYSYISFASSTTSPLLPAAQLGIGGDVGNWRIITVPYKLGNANVATAFAVLGADDFSKWRLITYKDQTTWSQYPNDFTAFVQGTGYFINIKSLPTNSSSGIIIPSAVSPTNNQGTPFSFTLKPGWNQIGNPYTFPMEWNEVLTSNNSPAGIATTLKTFNGTNYVDVPNLGKLAVFEGAFVLNSGTSSVPISVPIAGKYAGGRIAASEPTPTISRDLANETWTAPISLNIGSVENTFGGIGMNPDASVGVDKYDDFNPPRWFDYAEMNFAHPEHFLKTSTKDIVPTQQEYTWTFDVTTNVNGLAELIWDNSKFGFNSKDLILVDLNRETLINMRGQNSYSFDPKKSTSFKIYFGDNVKEKIKPLSITLGDAYPNPTSNTKVTIPFTLPDSQSAYQVEMDIYNSMGQKVSSILSESLSTGFYSSQWEPSENLLSGMYIYRLKVAGKENSSVISKKLIVNH